MRARSAPGERAWADHGIEIVVTPGWRYTGRDAQGQPNGDEGPIVNGEIYPADAVAQASTVTRAEVKAELAEAIRTGDIVAEGDSGKKLNELYPNRYRAN